VTLNEEAAKAADLLHQFEDHPVHQGVALACAPLDAVEPFVGELLRPRGNICSDTVGVKGEYFSPPCEGLDTDGH
jgi:hypothetical protein